MSCIAPTSHNSVHLKELCKAEAPKASTLAALGFACMACKASRLEAIAGRLEAIVIGLEALGFAYMAWSQGSFGGFGISGN